MLKGALVFSELAHRVINVWLVRVQVEVALQPLTHVSIGRIAPGYHQNTQFRTVYTPPGIADISGCVDRGKNMLRQKLCMSAVAIPT